MVKIAILAHFLTKFGCRIAHHSKIPGYATASM
jgi:hypothetical protein